MTETEFRLTVNGAERSVACEPDTPLLDVLRLELGSVPGYDIPGIQVTRHRLLDMPIRTSSLRSLGAHLNVFAIESFMDELAAAAGADPVRFRLAHLTDPRARQVLTQAADMAGWDTRVRRAGTGYGAGGARYSGVAGYCAAVAEVEADTDIRVRRVWLAVDVGRVINPDGVINQVEGGAVQSASWALREQVRFDRDKITSARTASSSEPTSPTKTGTSSSVPSITSATPRSTPPPHAPSSTRTPAPCSASTADDRADGWCG